MCKAQLALDRRPPTQSRPRYPQTHIRGQVVGCRRASAVTCCRTKYNVVCQGVLQCYCNEKQALLRLRCGAVKRFTYLRKGTARQPNFTSTMHSRPSLFGRLFACVFVRFVSLRKAIWNLFRAVAWSYVTHYFLSGFAAVVDFARCVWYNDCNTKEKEDKMKFIHTADIHLDSPLVGVADAKQRRY